MSATVAVQQTKRFAEGLSTPEQLQQALARVFQDSQTSVAGHRKQVIILRSILERSVELDREDSFHYFFCKLVNKVLVIKRSESVGDRIVKLVASFILRLHDEFSNDDEKDDDEENEAEDTVFTRFVNYFIAHLLRGIESRDKNVRYRVVQFLDFAMSGLGEIDDQLYETLLWALDKRLHDKEPSIRIKALHCIARFQETDTENEDEIDEATAKLLMAIQNDSSAEVRRAALLNLVRTNTTKHYLLERAKDINSINRRIVYSRVIKDFGDFRTIDSKAREKLLSWGLKDREQSVQKACIKMFAVDWLQTLDGDMIELLERLHITQSEVAELAMKQFFQFRKDILSKISFPPEVWLKLSPEISFLARTFYYHCNENSLNDIIDSNYPESAELANLLTKYLDLRKQLNDLEDAEDLDFVIEQLLIIGVNYDFSDEIGRRAMLQVIRSSLSNDRLTDKLIKVALQVLRKLSISEKDFCAMVTEIITDIRDSDLDDEEEEEGETHENEKNLIHSLTICKSMLQLTNEPLKDNLSLTSLIDTLINPAVRNNQSTIRELGTESLGLCCLLDQKLATDQLYLFGLCLSKGHEELKTIAIRALFDALSVHGTKILDVEDGVDSLSFHKLLYRTLKDGELPEVQALCGEGLCKLYLADILNDDELFETLILTYYNPLNSGNQSLLQAFSFCLPVYCFSHPTHQEKMAKVASDAFVRLYNAHAEEQEETDLEMVEPSTVLQQIIHWTDPANVVNQTEENISQSRTHLILGIDLLNSLNEVKSKKFRKLVLTNISTLSIGSALSYKDLKSLKETIDDKEEFISESDQATKNRVNKLLNKLEPLLAEAETKHEPTQVEIEDNAKDQEYSQILENPHFKTENSNDEVDEEYEEEQSRMLQEVSLHYEDAEGDEGQAHNVEITANDISKIIDEDGDLSME